jgi:hypothetical protein
MAAFVALQDFVAVSRIAAAHRSDRLVNTNP